MGNPFFEERDALSLGCRGRNRDRLIRESIGGWNSVAVVQPSAWVY